MWNFTRLYTMPLMTYKSCPGTCGLQVVPDLATAPGIVSDNGLTWTYHIKPNVKFEDGTTVISSDVKYAVERTFDRTLFPLGPSYYTLLLGGNAATYPGPYKDPAKNKFGLTAIDTPNATTIVFHLAKPFADFNYVAAIPQSAPVPPAHDTGANYQLHPMVHRPVQVPELPAEQAAHAGAQHVLEPGHRPEREAAGQQDHRHHEHERQRHRQPAARG